MLFVSHPGTGTYHIISILIEFTLSFTLYYHSA